MFSVYVYILKQKSLVSQRLMMGVDFITKKMERNITHRIEF